KDAGCASSGKFRSFFDEDLNQADLCFRRTFVALQGYRRKVCIPTGTLLPGQDLPPEPVPTPAPTPPPPTPDPFSFPTDQEAANR
ncbi:unnamed protein product, partial [Chrysoparadoxa australica]